MVTENCNDVNGWSLPSPCCHRSHFGSYLRITLHRIINDHCQFSWRHHRQQTRTSRDILSKQNHEVVVLIKSRWYFSMAGGHMSMWGHWKKCCWLWTNLSAPWNALRKRRSVSSARYVLTSIRRPKCDDCFKSLPSASVNDGEEMLHDSPSFLLWYVTFPYHLPVAKQQNRDTAVHRNSRRRSWKHWWYWRRKWQWWQR